MSLAERIILELAKDNDFASDEALAQNLGVSSEAVHEALAQLRAEGLVINDVHNTAYRLAYPVDPMGEDGISQELGEAACRFDIHYKRSTESTNDDTKELARSGAVDGTVVVASGQSRGKGRRGRSFFSPEGCGVYLSMLVREPRIPNNPLMLTVAAAVAVSRAIKQVCGLDASIKWVNDVYLNRKKVCGILTEAETNLDTGLPQWAVVGIGINVYEPPEGWPAELADKVGALTVEVKVDQRNKLAAAIITHLDALLEDFESDAVLKEYFERSNIIGQHVRLHSGEESLGVVEVVEIADDLSLRVRRLEQGSSSIESYCSADTRVELI